jgi:uncharacterized protein (DUF58 family)
LPAPATAPARRKKRLAGGFGPRFFLLLVVGFVWLAPAFREPRFFYALLAWDVLVVIAWAVDLAGLPRPGDLHITRSWQGVPALSVKAAIALTVENKSRTPLHITLIDNVPSVLRKDAPQLELAVAARNEASASYDILPTARGEVSLHSVYLRYQSALRIAERWAVAELPQRICVYPNLQEARRHAIYLVRSRQIELEKRHSRIKGAGREFESLREYREGDEYRDVCWTASARRGKLVTRLYQVERSQTIWLVLDAGRLMRTRVAGLTKLDYAVNAALSLGQVALGTGDRVGLLTYGRGIRQRVAPYRGSAHLRQIIEQLARVHSEAVEGDHLQAVSALLSAQQRRSLIVWITDFPETAMTPEVIDAAAQMTNRHLVLFVVIGQPDLEATAGKEPRSVTEMFLTTAAQEMMHRREVLLARLRQRGALAVEVSSASASTAVVNSYLDVKQRNLL